MRKLTVVVFAILLLVLSACKEQEDSRFADGSFRYNEENLPKICVTEYTYNDGINIIAAVLGLGADKAAEKLIVCETADQCYEKLKNGECDIVLAHKYGKAVEKAIQGTDVTFVSTEIKTDALVFVTNSKTQVDSLTKPQVTSIFKQEITDWGSIKGEKTSITLFGKAKGTAVQNAFESLVSAEITVPKVTKEVITANGKFIAEIGYDNRVGGITYELLSFAEKNTPKSCKLLKIEGVEPTLTNVNSGEYPYKFSVLATMRQSDTGNLSVNNFYKWICEGQGKELIK